MGVSMDTSAKKSKSIKIRDCQFKKSNQSHTNQINTPHLLIISKLPNGFSVEYFTLEIGARGIVNKENKESIKDISIYTTINAKKLTKEVSKQAVISSYFIFLNRNERDWNNNVT